MEEVFSQILDDNEKVLKIIKPNKFALYFKNMLACFLLGLFTLGFVCFGFIMSLFEETDGVTPITNERDITASVLICIGILAGILLVALLLTWLFAHIYYKNVYYAYTNKRILIRKGIFGVDYKSLDIKMIGASTVTVSLIDKIIRKNTGTINFGSMASPINGTTSVNNFILSNVVDPYGLYKEIKNHISTINDNGNISVDSTTEK